MASESVLVASSVLAVGVKVPVQVLLSALVIDPKVIVDQSNAPVSVPLATVMSAELEKEATASENTSVTVALSPALSAVSESVKLSTEGAVVSMVKELTVKAELTLAAESVTIIVQSL